MALYSNVQAQVSEYHFSIFLVIMEIQLVIISHWRCAVDYVDSLDKGPSPHVHSK